MAAKQATKPSCVFYNKDGQDRRGVINDTRIKWATNLVVTLLL